MIIADNSSILRNIAVSVVLSLCLAVTAACTEESPRSLSSGDAARIAKRLLSQEVQEINFFSKVCVQSTADVKEVRKFFKDLEAKGLPSEERTDTVGSTLSFSNNDYAVGVWKYKDLVTNAHYLITVTKQGKCKVAIRNKQLIQQNLRKEFSDFAFATAYVLNGESKRVTEELPPNAPFTLEKYVIKNKDSDNTSVIAVIIPYNANDLYEFTYQGSLAN
jgi:hypothetical protein